MMPIPWWYGTHCVLDPSDGVFGRFDLAALGGCHTLNVCYVVMLCYVTACRPAPLHFKGYRQVRLAAQNQHITGASHLGAKRFIRATAALCPTSLFCLTA